MATLTRSAAMSAGARASALAMNLGFSVTSARVLGPTAAGPFYTALTISILVAMVGRFGLDILALRRLTVDLATDGAAQVVGTLRSYYRWCNGTSLIALVLTEVAALVAHRWSGSRDLAILGLSMPAQNLAIVASSMLRACGRTTVGAFAEVGLLQGGAMFLCCAAWLHSHHATSTQVSSFVVISAWLTALWACWVVRNSYPRATVRRSKHRSGVAQTDLIPLANITFASSVNYALTWVPVFVIGFLSGPAEVAFYVAASRLAVFLVVPNTIQTAHVIPTVALRLAAGDKASANRTLTDATRRSMILVIPAGIILCVFSNDIIRIVYGHAYSGAAIALSVMAIAQTFVAMFGFVQPVMLLAHLEVLATAVAAGSLIAAIALLAIGSHFGLGAACVGFAVVLVAQAFAGEQLLRRGPGLTTAALVRTA